MPPMTCFTEADEDRFLDHVESPFHRGKLQAPAVSSTICNPYCGDEVTLQLVIQDQRITEAWFYGDGCAVSQAAASMLCECINGQKFGNRKNHRPRASPGDAGDRGDAAPSTMRLAGLSNASGAAESLEREVSIDVSERLHRRLLANR